MPAMHLEHAHTLTLNELRRVLVESIGPVATQTGHREGAHLDLRCRLEVDRMPRAAARFELGKALARLSHDCVTGYARTIVGSQT